MAKRNEEILLDRNVRNALTRRRSNVDQVKAMLEIGCYVTSALIESSVITQQRLIPQNRTIHQHNGQ
jgi:hypothetical protein